MEKNEQNIVTEIINFNNLMLTTEKSGFSERFKEAKKNIDAVFGDHWDTKQKAKFTDQGRVPLSLPLIFPKALSLMGFEKENRQIIETSATGKEDELTSEIVNQRIKHILDQPDPKKYEFTKSDVYQDGMIPCFGCSEIYVETNDKKQNVIKIKHHPYNQIVFDLNFTDYELDTCRRWQHFYDCYVDDLIKEFPKRAEEFEKIEETFNDENTFPQRGIIENYFFEEKNTKKKIVRRIRDWKRVNTTVYMIHDITEGEKYEFTTESEANEKFEELKLDKPQSELEIEPVPKEMIEYTEIAGNVVITEPEIQEVDESPLNIYFSLFIMGQWYTPIQIMRGLQEFMDRLFSQLDYSIGIDAKGGAEVDINLIAEGYNDVDQIKAAYVDGGLVFKDGQGRLITPMERTGANSQYFTIFEFFFQMLEDGFGGRNFQGTAESSGQSGKAIQSLLRVAQVLSNNYLDNLRRYDLQVGKKLIKFMQKYTDYKYSFAVQGEAMNEKVLEALKSNGLYEESLSQTGKGWLTYDPTNENVKPLSDTSFNLSLTSVSSRLEEAELTRVSLMELQKLGYGIPLEAILETMPLKATMKAKIISHNKDLQAQQQQMMLKEKQFQGLQQMQENNLNAAKTIPEPQTQGE